MPRSSFTAAAALAAALALPLSAACSREASASPAPQGSTAGDPAPGVVDVATAKRLIEDGARVVDVRTPQEFAAGHVPGAVNIPFDEIPVRASEIGGPETKVVLYCRSGRRSGIAADALRKLGFTKLYDFQRYGDWAAAEGR